MHLTRAIALSVLCFACLPGVANAGGTWIILNGFANAQEEDRQEALLTEQCLAMSRQAGLAGVETPEGIGIKQAMLIKGCIGLVGGYTHLEFDARCEEMRASLVDMWHRNVSDDDLAAEFKLTCVDQ